MTEKSAVLFANGEFVITERIMEIVHKAELFVAVDGGFKHMNLMGLTPHVIVGDLDSIDLNRINELGEIGVEIKKFDVHKDETDLDLAVDYILEMGFEKIMILGATGGRADHYLGNILIFSNPKYSRKEIKILTENEEIYYCKNIQEIIGEQGDLVSLIPISDHVTGIKTSGLLYPLNDETLDRWKSRGISNQLSGQQAVVQFETGILLCIHRFAIENESRKQ